MVMKMLKMNMPPRPHRCKVRRPARSIKKIDTIVMPTIMAPIPKQKNANQTKKETVPSTE